MLKRCTYVLAMTLIALLCATSCKESKVGDILDKVPAEVELVMVGNPRIIIENAGGEVRDSKFKLPTAITDLMDSKTRDNFDQFNDMLQAAGINLDACALVMDRIETGYPIIIFGIKDNKKFIKSIQDMEFDEFDTDDDITFYRKKTYNANWDNSYDQYTYVALCGSYGYLMPDISRYKADNNKPTRVISRLVNDAEDQPISRTEIAKFITSGNAGGYAVRIPREVRRELKGNLGMLALMLDGVICTKFDLGKDDAKMVSKYFTAEGKPLDLSPMADVFDASAKIDRKALSYLGANEQLVVAMALKDIKWSKYIDMLIQTGAVSQSDARQLETVETYLKQLDGTIAFGIGLTKGLESIVRLSSQDDILSYISFTLVVSTKRDKAPSLLREIQGLLDQVRIPYVQTSDGLKVGFGDLCLYLKANDNYLVASNNQYSDGKNKTVSEVNFTDYLAAAGIYLDANSQLLNDLEINNDLEVSAYVDIRDQKVVMEYEIEGRGPDGFLARLIKLGTEFSNNLSTIQNRIDSYRPTTYVEPYDSYSEEIDDMEILPE